MHSAEASDFFVPFSQLFAWWVAACWQPVSMPKDEPRCHPLLPPPISVQFTGNLYKDGPSGVGGSPRLMAAGSVAQVMEPPTPRAGVISRIPSVASLLLHGGKGVGVLAFACRWK